MKQLSVYFAVGTKISNTRIFHTQISGDTLLPGYIFIRETSVYSYNLGTFRAVKFLCLPFVLMKWHSLQRPPPFLIFIFLIILQAFFSVKLTYESLDFVYFLRILSLTDWIG